MMTMEVLDGLGEATVEDVDKRVVRLEKLHYVWAPIILVALIGGVVWWRSRR